MLDLLSDRYRILEPVAGGGTATVWRARDEWLSRPVAVKVMRPTDHAGEPTRLVDEASLLAQLSHPHVAAVYDIGMTNGVPFLVMELVEGEPLSAVLDKCGHLAWPAAILACGQVADVLASAHSRGIVHRDITAANVLVTPSGVKLIDFGLSAWQGSAEVGPDGKLFGTPVYVAPERFDAAEVLAPSDVYALGVLLYRCLSGRIPWPQLPTEQLLAVKASLPPTPLPAIAGLPHGVAELCLQCLARNPAERPSAAAVAADLQATYRRATADTPVLPNFVAPRARPTTGPSHALPRTRSLRRPARAAFGLGLTGALAAGGVAWALANLDGNSDRVGATPIAPNPVPTCSVTYRQVHDDGQHFTATIEVSQRGAAEIPRWLLSFTLADTQTLDAAAAPDWQQTDNVVVSVDAPREPLHAGAAADLAFAGNYRGANPIPTQFALNARPCDVTIYGPTSPVPVVGTVPPPSTADPPSSAPPATTKRTGKLKASGADPGHDQQQKGNGNGNGA